MIKKQSITILGSTGSIGMSTLDVVAHQTDRFEIFALVADKNHELLAQQCACFAPQFAVLADAQAGRMLADRLAAAGSSTIVLWGAAAIEQVTADERVDIVMAAIVGMAGLASCLAAARSGKRLLLANKEALVVGGDIFMAAVCAGGATLLPIDSEHSAIFQSLPGDYTPGDRRVDKVILTASGGPFRQRAIDTLSDITWQEACLHPNWSMGKKISVDSATMMNKVLEVIEAKYLFGLDPEHIEVVIHPQSIIHSMVQYIDGSIIAQMGAPDMRGPISFGLAWPQRMASPAPMMNFKTVGSLTFESIDQHQHSERFPCLALAWQVLNAGAGHSVTLNAVNEVAVDAFLHGRIRFDHIYQLNAHILNVYQPAKPSAIDDLLVIHQEASRRAEEYIGSVLC
jgi:1-deoxy-D-xylulose-5-phosphate reductoisomerase